MAGQFKKRVVLALTADLRVLAGGDFEQFCYPFLDAFFPQPEGGWRERGTTIEGSPRGYTIDSSVPGATRCAEMSSDRDYFSGDLSKPKRDIVHILDMHPKVKKIVLLAAKEMPAGATTAVEQLAATEIERVATLDSVEVLGAREIAIKIFAGLDSDSAIRALQGYLPSLLSLADEHAFSMRLPDIGSYQARPDLLEEVRTRLQQDGAVLLSGISGSGKSVVAAQLAHEVASEFESVYWLDGRTVSSIQSLADIDVRRSGVHHNLLATLKRRRCLLVLDDITFPWSDCQERRLTHRGRRRKPGSGSQHPSAQPGGLAIARNGNPNPCGGWRPPPPHFNVGGSRSRRELGRRLVVPR